MHFLGEKLLLIRAVAFLQQEHFYLLLSLL